MISIGTGGVGDDDDDAAPLWLLFLLLSFESAAATGCAAPSSGADDIVAAAIICRKFPAELTVGMFTSTLFGADIMVAKKYLNCDDVL